MTANDRQIDRAALHIMGGAVGQAIEQRATFGEGHVRVAFESWCAQTRHMAFHFQGSNSKADPLIDRTKAVLARLGYPQE